MWHWTHRRPSGGGQARCLRVSKVDMLTSVHLGISWTWSCTIAVSSQSRLVVPTCLGWMVELPAQGLCGGMVVRCFTLGFVFWYICCKCHRIEGSSCIQACAFKMVCWCLVTRVQLCSAILSTVMWQDSCVFPSPPASRTGLCCESSEITLGKYSDFFLSKIYLSLFL